MIAEPEAVQWNWVAGDAEHIKKCISLHNMSLIYVIHKHKYVNATR